METLKSIRERQDKRQAYADECNDEYYNAVDACGPGKSAYGKMYLVERRQNHRDPIEPVETVYCCREDDKPGWHPSPEEAFGDKLHERSNEFFELNGKRYHYMKYSMYRGTLDLYQPQSAETIARSTSTRLQRKLDKQHQTESESLSLFSDELRDEHDREQWELQQHINHNLTP